MAANRRAITEALGLDDSDEAIDLNNLNEDQLRELAKRAGYDIDEESEEDGDEQNRIDSDVDDIDFQNFKGIYFNDDPNRKYQDPETGAHFEYFDLCKRMVKLKELRKKIDKELGLAEEEVVDSPKQQ